MIGALEEAGPHAPQVGCKNDDGQEEEDSGDLKPDDAADAAEGTQKPAHAPGDTTASLAGHSACSAGLLGVDGDGTARRGAGSGLRAGRHVLAGDATGNTQPYAQDATDGLRFHFEYDGSSDNREAYFCRVLCATQLLRNRVRRKVDKTRAAPRACSAQAAAPGGIRESATA